MATISSSSSDPVTITIPGDFLEDVRTALIAEIDNDSDAIRADHEEVLSADRPEWAATCQVDRAAAVRILREDMHLLDQVLQADGDPMVMGERSAVTHALEAVVRVLSGRLVDACVYAPIGMGAVVELSAAMRWAAEEAIRIEPALDERTVA